jgi:hypothetical protein
MAHPTEPMLRGALEHLAADAKEQETHLREVGAWPSLDELALDLDTVALASEVWTPPLLRERVRLLDHMLEEMSGQEHAELWEGNALHGAEWAEVRRLAADALAAFGEHS